MKRVFSLILCMLSAAFAMAADLTASVSPAAAGKKDGKISLAVAGGFAPYTFSWTGPGGYTSALMSPGSLGPGIYCVTVTDKYCGTASLCVTIDEKPTGIPAVATESISVYPNPFGGKLFIRLGDDIHGVVHLQLFDNTGRLVSAYDTEARADLLWDIGSSLTGGTYILSAGLPDGTRWQTRVHASGK